MRRKIKDSVIENLESVCSLFLGLSMLISFFISMFSLPSFLPGRPGPFTRDIGIIAFIYFLISFICYGFLTSGDYGELEFLRKRNDKIDEEEKARQQALLLEAEERNMAELQIWVSE
jgi:hypothetical protein